MAERLDLERGDMQSAVTCDTCDNTAEHLCKTCHDKLCTKCKAIHSKSRSSYDHEVTELNSVSLLQLAAQPLVCRTHPGCRADVCCRKCEIPVCEKCLVGEHHDHKTISKEELFLEKRNKLDEKYSFLQSELPHYQAQMELLKDGDKKLDKNRDIIENEITFHFNEAQRKLDIEKNRLMRIAHSHYQREHCRLQSQKTRISEYVNKTESFIKMYGTEIPSERYAFILYANASPGSVLPKTLPQFTSPFTLTFNKRALKEATFKQISGEIGVQLMQEMLELENIRIGTSTVESMAYQIKDETFWLFLAGDSCYKKCSRTGKVFHKVETEAKDCRNKPIFVSYDGMVIFRKTSNCLKLINEKDEESTFLNLNDYTPICIYLTERNTEIAVAMLNSAVTAGKISKFNSHGQCLSELKNKLLFRHIISNDKGNPTSMVENVNGDIYISNTEVDVFDKNGNFRFSYKGWRNAKFPFHPRGICTDLVGNILIADEDNRCIHVLDVDLNLQKLYDLSSEKEKFCPVALAVDAYQCLSVGCSDGNIRVFKYIE